MVRFIKNSLLKNFFKIANENSYKIILEKTISNKSIYKKSIFVENKKDGIEFIENIKNIISDESFPDINIWSSQDNDVLSITFGTSDNLYAKSILFIKEGECEDCIETDSIKYKDLLDFDD